MNVRIRLRPLLFRRFWQVAGVLTMTVGAVVVGLGLAVTTGLLNDSEPEAYDLPPPAEGYFTTQPHGSPETLPGDRACARRVHRSLWEPRPDNYLPNQRTPDPSEVHRAFATRPRATQGAYAPQWDRWLLPRLSGGFTGSTDEILQWASCKWGIADNVLRSVALRESGWYQHQVYGNGTCVVGSGCGDLFPDPSRSGSVFCREVAAVFADDERTLVRKRCPKTFSIVGVMAWHDPRWGRMEGNQNGTFPFSMQSTAFAADYLGSFLRGCLEGWVRWLDNTGKYHPGDLSGCLGAWYAGAWKSVEARGYAARVEESARARTWLDTAWARQPLPCIPLRGCPEAAP